MPSMSAIEQGFCRSAPWRGFTRTVILPWALGGLEPEGQLLELGAGSGAMSEGTARTFPHLHLTVTDIDPAMVAAARASLGTRPHIDVEQADVTASHVRELVAASGRTVPGDLWTALTEQGLVAPEAPCHVAQP